MIYQNMMTILPFLQMNDASPTNLNIGGNSLNSVHSPHGQHGPHRGHPPLPPLFSSLRNNTCKSCCSANNEFDCPLAIANDIVGKIGVVVDHLVANTNSL